jgi:hypothetical protein
MSALRLPYAAERWLFRYLVSRTRSREPAPRTVWLVLADHFEPLWRRPDEETAGARVGAWTKGWPVIAARHRDSAGRPPCYTFFYPEEEYRPEYLESLAGLVREGIADVEIHLHHDGEGQQDFVERIAAFKSRLLDRHGLLRRQGDTVPFGFIHGNWALDNSRPDGRYCGLNNEIGLLRDLGCYADFTLPCVPDPAQAGPVNRIYWATDDPRRPRSHDRGVPASVGGGRQGDLLMVPGPLALSFQGRKPWRPRVETGELAAHWRPTPRRVQMWLDRAPRLGSHVFVKLFAHGAQERHLTTLLGGALDEVFTLLAAECAIRGLQLRFASAWDAYRAIAALVSGAASP